MKQYFVYATICVLADNNEEAEENVRQVLNVCTEPDNDLMGFTIESSEESEQ